MSRAMVVRLMDGHDFLDEPEIGNTSKELETDDDNNKDEDDSDLDVDVNWNDSDDDSMQVDEETEGDASILQRKYGRPTKKEINRTERTVEEENEDEEWEIEVARVYSRVLEDIGGKLGGDPIGIVVDE
ncbi:hypothetical protein H072_2819 [Dactylellina haptotyla CBS 200.50]|uniref:Uncharacterized protein n=1 Tax=Dactylellina haptotyla (strain CBS 200.50) TaxID=1284197 RepID=S8AQ30_DACHA|nr:hypothetical protein H072_2819 [Dactylellina haptotyla CBS 200.50]